MGRGRGKGKKLTVASSHEDPASGNEEQPLAPYKRRGRPQKPLKDDIDEEELAKIEEEEEEEGDLNLGTPVKETKAAPAVENGKRRRRQSVVKESFDSVLEENGAGLSSTTTEESARKNGFRQNGSRRKNKPRRAAEAGVEFQ